MRQISRMIVALIAGGFMVASAQASLTVISNPHNMVIAHYHSATGTWGNWGIDTLQTAYEAGQVTITDNGQGWYGTTEEMVDGLTSDWAIDGGYEAFNGGIVDFKFESSYTGGRTLGAESQQAMRVKHSYHQNRNGFHYRLEYSTTAAPTVFQTLVELIENDQDTNWDPKMTAFTFDAGSTLVTDVDTIRYVQLDVNDQGLVEEINVTMIPEPASMVLIGLGGLAALVSRRFRI